MFDIGFSELMIIGVVALVVIGPERLPRVARTLGVLFGRMQRYVAQVKSDIGREIDMAELRNVKSEFETAARGFQSDIESKAAEVEREMREAQASIERDLAGKSEAAPGEPAPGAEAPAGEAASAPASPQLELGIEEPAPAPRDKPAA